MTIEETGLIIKGKGVEEGIHYVLGKHSLS
jgi:hypothetical protein